VQKVVNLKQKELLKSYQKGNTGLKVDYSTELEPDDRKTYLLVLDEKNLKAIQG
jgi:hypothetical protein